MGHAINKILKDIVLRFNISEGRRVHFHPGWDCHGLPIELKAIKNQTVTRDPLVIRKTARNYALQTLDKQRDAFSRWGVTADWTNDKRLYKTFDKDYIKNEITIFYELYKNGFIYRVLKPVYWSPSSHTALAEAELEYDSAFESSSLYVRFKLNDVPAAIRTKVKGDLYAIIWTTTPWTLPSNQAVCYNKELEYVVVKLDGFATTDHFIVSAEMAKRLGEALGGKSVEVVDRFTGSEFEGCTYWHPINKHDILPFLSGTHVEAAKGTGLVHTAPAHGPDDFLVSLANGISVKCIVDENGNYTDESPSFLRGQNVITDGNRLVLDYLGSENVLHVEKFVHSYPIDWRTKKPVIWRASKQWFINTDDLKTVASELITNSVRFYPRGSADTTRASLLTQVQKRPYWCISRQRSWGVPIPVFYRRDTGAAIVEPETITRIVKLIEHNKSVDFWWNQTVEEIFPQEILPRLGCGLDVIEKGTDILDIWFDSGVSWSYALTGDKIADLYMEGKDQTTGWFQTSLLTSVAVRGTAPYKSLFVHGFAVDEKGLKMSKSLGNVIAPHELIQTYGTDALRWWVASHATQHTNIEVSRKLLESSGESVQKVRGVLKYLLGVVEKIQRRDDKQVFDVKPTRIVDKSILYSTHRFNEQLVDLYRTYQFNRVTPTILNFVTNDLSSSYLHFIKDRLYCGPDDEYASLQSIFEIIFVTLCKNLYPIVPFLVEEAWSHYSVVEAPFYQTCNLSLKHFEQYAESMDCLRTANELRDSINHAANGKNTWTVRATIKCDPKRYSFLRNLHFDDSDSFINESELCEILQVAAIHLQKIDGETFIGLSPNLEDLCPRCRRFSLSTSNHTICNRCDLVMKSKRW